MCDRKLLISGLDRLGISLEVDRVDNIFLYCRELQKWNKRINLIARNTPATEVLEKHFLDSLTLLPVLDQYGANPATLLDVGTGAGFPGMVLAVAMPGLHVTLVEPRQKRVFFLRHIIRMLQLANVRVVEDRLEHAGLNENDFTFITSRAVADAGRFLAMLGDIPGAETMVILMQATDDLEKWIQGGQATGWQLVENIRFQLPFSGAPRLLSVVSKHSTQL